MNRMEIISTTFDASSFRPRKLSAADVVRYLARRYGGSSWTYSQYLDQVTYRVTTEPDVPVQPRTQTDESAS